MTTLSTPRSWRKTAKSLLSAGGSPIGGGDGLFPEVMYPSKAEYASRPLFQPYLISPSGE